MLSKDEDLISDLAMQLEPEDGRLWIYDTDDREKLGFTDAASRASRSSSSIRSGERGQPASAHQPRPWPDGYDAGANGVSEADARWYHGRQNGCPDRRFVLRHDVMGHLSYGSVAGAACDQRDPQ